MKLSIAELRIIRDRMSLNFAGQAVEMKLLDRIDVKISKPDNVQSRFHNMDLSSEMDVYLAYLNFIAKRAEYELNQAGLFLKQKQKSNSQAQSKLDIAFVDQSSPLPDEFKACVTRAIHDYFPRKKKVGALGRYVDHHVEAVQAAVSLEFEDCVAACKIHPDKLTFTISHSKKDTGFAFITIPITCEQSEIYVGGVS